MSTIKPWLPYISRVLISLAICLVGAWLISEVSYQATRDPGVRDDARRIDLVIPYGTADQVAQGQNTLALPATLTFVEGDLLVVKNEDTMAHQLGPVWVPARSNGVLQLNQANEYTYTCSFQTSKVLGIQVKPRLTASVRLEGTLAIGLPSAVLMAMYSFLVFPVKPKKTADGSPA